MGFRWKKGALLCIKLGEGREVVAQMLNSPEMAFFDPNNPKEVLFRLWVMHSAYSTGRWKLIGEDVVPPELESSIPRFKIDSISGSISINQDAVDRPAEPEECEGLERAAVWSANHIEDRLNDFIDGVPNKWVESLAFKPT